MYTCKDTRSCAEGAGKLPQTHPQKLTEADDNGAGWKVTPSLPNPQREKDTAFCCWTKLWTAKKSAQIIELHKSDQLGKWRTMKILKIFLNILKILDDVWHVQHKMRMKSAFYAFFNIFMQCEIDFCECCRCAMLKRSRSQKLPVTYLCNNVTH